MRLATFLLCSSFVFGQATAPSPEPKAQPPASSSDHKNQNQDSARRSGRRLGQMDILSDTKGIDFGPYLSPVLEQVRENWYHLIPESAEMKKGKLAIEFAITKDGQVADMLLVASSGDVSLDRPAWGSITASNPFRPLPSEFKQPSLRLRFRFFYNPDKSDFDDPITGIDLGESHAKAKSGIVVTISAPAPGNLEVPLGGSKLVVAVVTGTGIRENTVDWTLSGFGCSGAACGEMTNDSYHAPSIMPSSPFVTLTAASKADPSAKASVTLHIVDSNPSH